MKLFLSGGGIFGVPGFPGSPLSQSVGEYVLLNRARGSGKGRKYPNYLGNWEVRVL